MLITLLINICATIEIIMNNKIFDLSGLFPSYFYNITKDMKSNSGHPHLWPFLAFLIVQIPVLISLIIKYKKQKKPYKDNTPKKQSKKPLIEKDSLFNKQIQMTSLPDKNTTLYNKPDDNGRLSSRDAPAPYYTPHNNNQQGYDNITDGYYN